MSIYMIIKGSRSDAEAQAICRRIKIDSYVESSTQNEVYCYAPDQYLERVRDWFAEDAGVTVPYLSGSCLWFSQVQL